MTTFYTPLSRLSTNEALIALLVAAIEANQHASAEEAARAERVVHDLARLRRLSQAARGRMIEDMKAAVRDHGAAAVMAAACAQIPAGLRHRAMVAIAEVMATHGLDRIESAALIDVAHRFGFSVDDTAAAVEEARRNVKAARR
jgi:hypothetical protein